MNQAAGQKTEAGSTTETIEHPPHSAGRISLGVWGFYFLAKLALFWKELMGYHPWENLAFAAFILLPVNSPVWRKTKTWVTVILAVILLYHDSWLPPISRAFSQASLLSSFDFNYLIELIGRFINLPMIAVLVISWIGYWYLSHRIRIGIIVILAMLVIPIMQNSSQHSAAQTNHSSEPAASGVAADVKPPDMDKELQAFFTKEAARSVTFPAPAAGAAPFDVIFIHICSLSWDDIRAVGLENHPLWHRFDFLLTRFNSAATYSGPAAIRILRATCGQSTHTNLYSPTSAQCYLMSSLKSIGYEPNLAMNHDGHFDDFLKTVQAQGGMNIPPAVQLGGIPVSQHAFDDSPIYDDFSVLTRWLGIRQEDNSQRVALYYNTISLHDGNHVVGPDSRLNSLETYKFRLSQLLNDMEKFMQSLEKSGRRAVIVMIPEHGAAVRGDKMQIAGLRELPSPSITLVPVGIKIIGGDSRRDGDTLKIDESTSYLAVSQIIANMLKDSPFAKNSFLPSDYVADLPVTPFVSENSQAVVAEFNHRYFLRQDESEWIEYPK